ncbi:MAG: amino acid ABC transporter ATP-binding protein [Bacillota bacterium]
MLEINNLYKSYGELEVLNDFNFSIKENEIISIIGPSGSGKSTFLRTINFLEKVNQGNMIFKDKEFNMANISKKEILDIRKEINMVFQHYNLFNNKTALENITESLKVVHKKNKKEARKKAKEYLKLVNLESKENKYPNQLSGGQKQRIGIARALAVNPAIILLDEPTSALDPEWVGEVSEIIKLMAKRNSTMIIVTHEMSLAKAISDKVIFMDEGEIVKIGSSDEIFKSSKNKRLNQFLKNFK